MQKPKARETLPPERALRDVFRSVEAQPAPDALKDHVDRLTGVAPKRSGPN